MCELGADRRVKFFGQMDHQLGNLLFHYAELYGEAQGNRVVIKKRLNKNQIATTIGVARQSISRSFQNLIKQNYIEMQDDEIVIQDMDKLKKMIRDL